MFSRTKSTPSSIVSWNLPGTTFGLRNATRNSVSTMRVVRTISRMMKLKQKVWPNTWYEGPTQP